MNASGSEIERVRASVGALLGPLRSIAPLPSGSSGTSYLVETATGRFVAKALVADAQVLLNPSAQFELFASLARAGLAPAPAGVDARERILVTEFVEHAAAVSVGELRAPERIERLAAALRLLHDFPAAIPPFAPRVYAERYVARIGGDDYLAVDDRERYEELLSLAACVDTAGTTLCHNDLAAENLLFGKSIQFIDFDYAVSASPIIDLASVVVMNGFESPEARILVAAYFGGSSPFSETEFDRVQRLVRLLAHFWSLAAQHRIDDV